MTVEMLISELGKYPPETEINVQIGFAVTELEELIVRDGKLVLR